MDILFIHQAFPAQFGRLAMELNQRRGWRCRFLIEHLSSCPTPTQEMLAAVEINQIPGREQRASKGASPWPQTYAKWLDLCAAVRAAFEALPGDQPDLVVAHGGQGAPTLFLTDAYKGPMINYCEYYFPNRFADLTYRVDLPPASEVAPFYPRAINAPTLAALTSSTSGYSATKFQRDSFPRRFRDRIEVLFDGIDTSLYRPGRNPERRIGDATISASTKVVTFVARGLESMRGFDLFARMAAIVARERSDVLFLVVGADQVYYGWDNHHTGRERFKDWALERSGADPARFAFLGHILPEQLADVLATSDLHVYPSVPFVVSWSLFNALASGCVVLGADTDPVRELIEPGVNGLVVPLFDVEAMARIALDVLTKPAEYSQLREKAVERVLERYSLDVCVPLLKNYFERAVASGHTRA
jgi:glycosyltransferase involved in cell wall biosynthesis